MKKFKIEFAWCFACSWFWIPTIQSHRQNFKNQKGIEFLGDAYCLNLSWLKFQAGIILRII